MRHSIRLRAPRAFALAGFELVAPRPRPPTPAEVVRARLDAFCGEDPRDAAPLRVDALKNALLPLLFLAVCRKDIDDTRNMDYASFGGEKPPVFFGCDTSSACMSYMGRFMPRKREAIDKYLAAHASTAAQIERLFAAFLARAGEE